MNQTTSTKIQRHFWRCSDCLSVVATEGETDAYYKLNSYGGRYLGIDCTCGGIYTHMGRVERQRLVKDELRCACDARCTHAAGPTCECSCGGVNHGKGVVVAVTVDKGGVPQIKPVDTKALKVAEEFREAVEETKKALGWAFEVIQLKNQGVWVEYDKFCSMISVMKKFRTAQGYQTHKRRMAALQELQKTSKKF